MKTTKKSTNFRNVEILEEPTIKTGVVKFDDWFSKDGGMVIPSAIFLTGSSGAGKTTLMVNLMKWLKNTTTSLYSREMMKESVKEQTKNIVFDHDNAHISDNKTCQNFEEYLKELEIVKPKVIIIDSLQAIAMEDYPEMSEERACNMIVSKLRNYIEENNAVLFLVGHVTKDDTFAGRNTIMQFMDGHIEMIYNKKENYRTISWGQKNRKGPMGSLYYTFGEEGIEFYTESEWKIKTNSERCFENDILETFNGYLNTIDKNNPDYKNFKKEFDLNNKDLYKEYEDTQNNLLYINNLMGLIYNLSKKYNL